MAARWLNAALGTWILASGLMAGPGAAPFSGHLVLGVAIFVVAFMSMGVPRARFLNAALGASVVLSPFVLGYLDQTIAMSDMVVGILVVAFSLGPPPRERRARNTGAAA